MNIFVSNLSFNIQDDDLRKQFSRFGEVASVKVVYDNVTRRSRGIGFVVMHDDKAAETAIRELNGKTLDHKPIRVNESKRKDD